MTDTGARAGGARPRVVVPITVNFNSVRYLVLTGMLDALSQRADVILVTRPTDEPLDPGLQGVAHEVHAPPAQSLRSGYRVVRRKLDERYAARLASPSAAIDRRRARGAELTRPSARKGLRTFANRLERSLPGGDARLVRAYETSLDDHTNIGEFESFISELGADAVVTTTPAYPADNLLLLAAQRAGIPLCASILSFDNITTRGWIPVTCEKYLVWNAYNAAELRRGYPEASSSDVEVVGAPQFDFYSDPAYRWSDEAWREAVGLPSDRPVILFGAGTKGIVPHEPLFLAQLDDAIERGQIPGEPLVLLRRHPFDTADFRGWGRAAPDRWAPVLDRAKHVVDDEYWRTGAEFHRSGSTADDLARLVSTLAHCAVHVNTSSTMTVDGAFFDRPQVGPAYDDQPGRRYDRMTRELYDREHWLPINRSGGLAMAYSRDELVHEVAEGLRNPAARTAERDVLVREIVTFRDGRATERTVSQLTDFLGVGAPSAP